MANSGQYTPGTSGNPKGRPPKSGKGVSIVEFRRKLSNRSDTVLKTIDDALASEKLPIKEKVKVALEVAKLLGTLDKVVSTEKPKRPAKEEPLTQSKPKEVPFSNRPLN